MNRLVNIFFKYSFIMQVFKEREISFMRKLLHTERAVFILKLEADTWSSCLVRNKRLGFSY